MGSLKIRAYNVGFGDAFLVTVPDRGADGNTVLRYILIDVGNVLRDGGGRDKYLEPVLRNIEEILEGRPLDLYIMTHEHMDHVQGLCYGATRLDPPVKISVRYAWLTASAEGNAYYERFPEAKRKKMAMISDYNEIHRFILALMAKDWPPAEAAKALLVNNNPQSTQENVEYLRDLAHEQTAWIFHGCELNRKHSFKEAEFEIWAPEEDTTGYYGRFRPLTLGVTAPKGPGDSPRLVDPVPPEGVHEESFRNFLEKRRSACFENLLAIDRAANNTSIVFLLKWSGWNLLFSGDAEIRSWKTMQREKVLKPIHFLKVSHHGSASGTPSGEILDRILPSTPDDSRERVAVISTCSGIYYNVPDEVTKRMLSDKGLTIYSLDKDISPGAYLELEFPAEGGTVLKRVF